MKQKMPESNSRELSMNVDHGGPFLVWDDDPNCKTKKGMIIDTLFCNDPECHYVHIRAILVDQHFENDTSEGLQLLSEHFESKVENEHSPSQSLEASFDVETEELLFQDGVDVQSENKELACLLYRQISNGLSEAFKRRWRIAKEKDKEVWKEKDWSWWAPGELVSWSDVFPDDFQFMFSLCDETYLVVDHYCITPGCTCNDVAIIFFSIDEKHELGSVFTETKRLKVKEVYPRTRSKHDLLKCWDKLTTEYPDLKKRLQDRYKEMKRIGGEIAKMSGNYQAPVMAQAKVKRNAPCPCGSGKKFKKCCMDS